MLLATFILFFIIWLGLGVWAFILVWTDFPPYDIGNAADDQPDLTVLVNPADIDVHSEADNTPKERVA
jgi:hypothetical protein